MIEYVYSKLHVDINIIGAAALEQNYKNSDTWIVILDWLCTHGYKLYEHDEHVVHVIHRCDDPYKLLQHVLKINESFNFRINNNILIRTLVNICKAAFPQTLITDRHDITSEKNAICLLVELSGEEYDVKFSDFDEIIHCQNVNWFATARTLSELREHLRMQTTHEKNETEKCVICHEPHNITLNCRHCICDVCFVELYFIREQQNICPYCRQPVAFSKCCTIE